MAIFRLVVFLLWAATQAQAQSTAALPTAAATDRLSAQALAQSADAERWQGFYSGFAFGKAAGELGFDPGFDHDLHAGQLRQSYLGYMFARAPWVYGIELELAGGKSLYAEGYANETLNRLVTAKLRLGRVYGRSYLYGVLGYGEMRYVFTPRSDFTAKGWSVGLGAEYAANSWLSFGLEYLHRDADGDTAIAGQTGRINLDSLSLRITTRF